MKRLKVLCAMGCLLLCGCVEETGRVAGSRAYHRNLPESESPSPPGRRPHTHEENLAAIRQSRLRRKPILNQSEKKLFWALKNLIDAERLGGLQVRPQVNLGTAFEEADAEGNPIKRKRKTPKSTDEATAYGAICNKRADFCITDREWNPVAFVEYQGGGHYGDTEADEWDTMKRDEIKSAACLQAGVLYHDVPKGASRNFDAHLRESFLPRLLAQLGITEASEAETGSGLEADDPPDA